ncbi:MAG: CoA transferase, partial [Methanobacteriota archaeon]
DDAPVLPGTQIADYATGLYAAFAIVSALRTGKGSVLDISMTEVAATFAGMWFAHAAVPEPIHAHRMILTGGYACYNTYEGKDGRWLTLGALEPKFWTATCTVLGIDAEEHQFEEGDAQLRLVEELRALFRTKPRDAWVTLLQRAGVPAAPVLSAAEFAASPLAKERGVLDLPGFFFPAAPRRDPARAPELGEHTDAVLREWGGGRGP